MLIGKKISRSKADQLISKGAKLYDVRDPVSFRNGTLPGATNMTVRQVSAIQRLNRNEKLIFFGSGEDDDDLKIVLNYVHQFGFTNVYIINKDER